MHNAIFFFLQLEQIVSTQTWHKLFATVKIVFAYGQIDT